MVNRERNIIPERFTDLKTTPRPGPNLRSAIMLSYSPMGSTMTVKTPAGFTWLAGQQFLWATWWVALSPGLRALRERWNRRVEFLCRKTMAILGLPFLIKTNMCTMLPWIHITRDVSIAIHSIRLPIALMITASNGRSLKTMIFIGVNGLLLTGMILIKFFSQHSDPVYGTVHL